MNGYKVFYKGKVWEVHADTSYEATQKGMAYFKTKKMWEVTAVLAEKAGKQATTTLTN